MKNARINGLLALFYTGCLTFPEHRKTNHKFHISIKNYVPASIFVSRYHNPHVTYKTLQNRVPEKLTVRKMKEVEELWREVRDLSLGNSGRVERLECPPNPVEFLRDFITPNKPCVISNAISHWPALSSWPNHEYLSEALSAATISLHLTPTGAADALAPLDSSLCFASAHMQHVPFPEALSLISNSEPNKLVAYAQQQNDCFRSEYSSLAADCDPHLGWATEAIGSEPEAVNLWIGNQHSQTSFHKDHYENLYAVVTGEKHFILLPPTDVHRLYIRHYPAATYTHSSVFSSHRFLFKKMCIFLFYSLHRLVPSFYM